jgi:hypothetical protein
MSLDTIYTWIGSTSTQPACSAEALAWIAAVEAAHGGPIEAAQKAVYCTWVDMLKGAGTTNNTDFFAMASGGNYAIWPFPVIDDSTISFAACGVELFRAASLGSFNNYLPGDLNVNGITGGTNKYFRTGLYGDDFPQDDLSMWIYSRSNNGDLAKSQGYQSIASPTTGEGLRMTLIAANTTMNVRNRTSQVTGGGTTPVLNNTFGLIGNSRANGSYFTVWKNGFLLMNMNVASQTPTHFEVFFGGLNVAGSLSVGNEETRQMCLWALMPGMNANEQQDWFECIDYLQTNIITGGRDV